MSIAFIDWNCAIIFDGVGWLGGIKIHMKDICISIIYDFGMIAFNGTVIIETKRIKNGTKIIYKSLNGSNDRKVSVTKEVNPYRALINFFNKPNSYIYQFQYEYHEIINQLNICITGISGWKKNYLCFCRQGQKY